MVLGGLNRSVHWAWRTAHTNMVIILRNIKLVIPGFSHSY